jgi:hypothetical protein
VVRLVYVQGLRFYVLCAQEREGCLGTSTQLLAMMIHVQGG